MSTSACPLLEEEIIIAYAPVPTTIGVGYLGVAISALLYGITCCQTFHYYRSERAKHDHCVLRYSVAVLWLITGIQEALIIHALYWYIVTNFSNACTFISRVIWSIPAEIFMNTPLRIGVQGFLLYRVWSLGHNKYVTSICGVSMVAESMLNTAYAVRLSNIGVLKDVIVELRRLGLAALGTSLAVESLVTFTLAFYLNQTFAKSRQTKNRITGLIVLTVAVGGFTMLVTLAELMAYVLAPHGFIVIVFTFIIGKVYLNCILTALNVREFISENSLDDTDQLFNSLHFESGFDTDGLARPFSGNALIDIRGPNELRASVTKYSPNLPPPSEEV